MDIEHDSARSPAVFAYEYQPVLRRLKAANSIEACLFLALLHAATARPLADTFTGVTGTEMALHLLPPNSSSTWSCKPLSDTSKFMLRELASLSPLRTFYPPHLQVMQQVSWPKAMSESNAHEAFHFIAKSLLADSERLLFAYPGFKKSQLSERYIENEQNNLQTPTIDRVLKYKYKFFLLARAQQASFCHDELTREVASCIDRLRELTMRLSQQVP